MRGMSKTICDHCDNLYSPRAHITLYNIKHELR